METATLRFYPGSSGPAALPLGRFLPPLPPGVFAGWLAEQAPAPGWLLDPLGASPVLALEAARLGYRVLVASNNPISSFLLEMLARAPRAAEFQSALAALGAARRGDERLEIHIKNLYLTECDTCGERVYAQAFLWRKGETQPFARLYRCPRCGESGEQPVIPADLERLAALGGDRMQRARALQRVIPNEDEHRADVVEALECYLPRALYALFTLLNKLEGLGLPPEQARLLHAALIGAFDAGNTLWSWPAGRARPKQLSTPPQFRENNLWNALEESAALWAQASAQPVPLTRWPELPPESGGICLYRGRVKALMPLPDHLPLSAVTAVYPRPNQAFWTLCTLWAGWLWGPEAALPLRNVLDRRRYDWNWHTSAIHSALAAVGWNTPPSTPFFGVLPELAPGFLSAVITASEAAGFRLKGLALRAEQELAQVVWQPSGGGGPPAQKAESPGGAELEKSIREAMRADLQARGEPAPYLVEYAAGLTGLARAGAVPRSLNSIPGDLLTRIQAMLARAFADRALLKRYGAQAEEERGWWWLSQPARGGEAPALPLADQVEMEVVRLLQKRPTLTLDEVDQALCAQFSGLLTPPLELVRAVLESYAAPDPAQAQGAGVWRVLEAETPAARKADLQEMRAAIEEIGVCLGYETLERGGALVWHGKADAWWFYRMASSLISRYVLAAPPGPPGRCVLVLPGSRARLLRLKLDRDPRLEEATQGWHILKFRHLREIAAQMGGCASREGPREEVWEALLDDDPLTSEATQMTLFP